MHLSGILNIAESHVGFSQRFKDFYLVEVMRTFVDVRDMNGPSKSLHCKVRPAAFKLCGAQTLQRVDQAAVKAVFDIFNNVDRGFEVLLGGVELLVAMLHDSEVRKRLRCL